MATKASVERNNRIPLMNVRHRNRCSRCGRARGYMRFFKMCRLCVRKLANNGLLPGVKKLSW